MIYNIITSTPNLLTYLIKEHITYTGILKNLIKINVFNLKLKRKKKH
jgi:hypothetical protein